MRGMAADASPSSRRRLSPSVLVLALLAALAAAPADALAGWKFIANPGYNDATLRVCTDGIRIEWAVGGPSTIDPRQAGYAWPFRVAVSTADNPTWDELAESTLVLDRVGWIPYRPVDVDAGGFMQHREYSGLLHYRWTTGTLPVGAAVAIWANAFVGNPAMSKARETVVGACTVGKPKAPSIGRCYGLVPTIRGTKRDDVLLGTPGIDVITGGRGNDRIAGAGGNDVICGGPGDDRIQGGAGKDTLDGGGGKDRILGGDGGDRVIGGDAADDLRGGTGSDVLTGGAGPDILKGEVDDDYLWPEDGDDRAWGAAGADTLVLGFGNDRAGGGLGDDVIVARGGDDRIVLQGGGDKVDGGPGDDWAEIAGPSGVILDLAAGTAAGAIPLATAIVRIENVLGSAFDDVIYGDGGDNRLLGGPGADFLMGRGGADVVDGGAASDTCSAEISIACELAPV